ncbi:MAG: hypothetical protein GF308_12860 [Candidatus Heimdallarchaeota archaeon]|nr:hypothetical protein [Candidatus Heimdallarchaeota archaeon]
MSKIEILQAVLRGEELKPIPHAVWRHFPKDDLYADRLAEKQLDYLEKFDPVFMKVSPNGRYCVIDWGCEITFETNKITGSPSCTSFRIETIDEWSTLEELTVNEGMFGEQLKALKLIDKGVKDGTPFVETVFNPLMVASKLVESKELLVQSIRENPKEFHEGLKIIAKVMKDFSKQSIENGAAGIFLATQEATHNLLTEEEFKEFGMKYDLEILKAIENNSEFNIVHIHGENIMFELIAENYPVQALNWHDQITPPSIAEASKIFEGALLGGLEEKELLVKGSNEQITKQIQGVIDSVNGRRLIITPGCVIPIIVPDEKVHTAIKGIRRGGEKQGG